jgi:hypothetical protein
MTEDIYSRNHGNDTRKYNLNKKCSDEYWYAYTRAMSLKSMYLGYLRGQNRSPLGIGATRQAYKEISDEFFNVLNGKYTDEEARKKVEELEKKYNSFQAAPKYGTKEIFRVPKNENREILAVPKDDPKEIFIVPKDIPEGFKTPPLETILKN